MSVISKEEEILFLLVRLGLNTEEPSKESLALCQQDVDWNKVSVLSQNHGMGYIACDGLQAIYDTFPNDTLSVDKSEYDKMRCQWFGEQMDAELNFEKHQRVIAKLASFYEKHKIGTMLLKGYGLSLCYPVPEHRPMGDIDIFLFDLERQENVSVNVDTSTPAWKRADIAILSELGISVKGDSEHHTKFVAGGLSVENHYDFVNTRIRRSSKKIEKIFKQLALNTSQSLEVGQQRVFIPCPNLNALFLLRHTAGHFASEGVTLRNVTDWACFVQKEYKNVDWTWLWNVAREFNMHRFLYILNKICVKYLGFKVFEKINHNCQFVKEREDLFNRVLREILDGPDLAGDASATKKTSRWWQHRWKHRICYSDSLVSSFYTSVVSHLYKKNRANS